MGKKRELTQDEIWDDSALVRSWDEAVEEYKLYHSIHAKGENVEEILQAAEAAERTADGQVDDVESMQTNIVEAEVAGDEADRESHGAKGKRQADEPEVAPSTAKPPLETENVGGATWTIPGRMNIPEVQDEGLKNLMMAWYFAGYYTGLYEGQRQARQTTGS